MKKVLLININSDDSRNNSFPLGLAYLSAALKDYETEIFDLNFHSDDELFSKISQTHYDVIGISCYTGVFSRASRLARRIKEIDVLCLVAIGGYHATAEYRYIIENYQEFDVAIIGRGEEVLPEIMNKVGDMDGLRGVPSIAYRKNDKVIVNDCVQSTLFQSIVPDRSMEYLYFNKEKKERISCIATMRGCYHRCTFCSISKNDSILIYDNNIIEKDIANAVKNNANSLYFVNPDFLANESCLENTLNVLEKYPEIKTFKISTRADSILKNLNKLEYIFKRGCNSIEVGIESFSDSQLKRYNKGVTAEKNMESYKVIMDLSKQFKFRYIHEIIPFDPWVTKKELEDTFDFYINNDFDYLEIEPWLFTRLMLYPQTDLRLKAEKEGIINSGNFTEIPEWKFLDSSVAAIYSTLIKYKYLLLPNIVSLRREIDILLVNRDVSFAKKSVLFGIQDVLSKITIGFVDKLLLYETSHYEELLKEGKTIINSISLKIRRIRNET